MKLGFNWIAIFIFGIALLVLFYKGKIVYEAFQEKPVEGFVSMNVDDIQINTCPAKTTTFVDDKGNTVCCDGDVESNKCMGTLTCSLTKGNPSLPSCDKYLVALFEQRGADRCPKSMPNYYENFKTGERGCAAGKRKKDGSAPEKGVTFCKMYVKKSDEENKLDSCTNVRMKDNVKCFSNANVNTKTSVKSIKTNTPAVIQCEFKSTASAAQQVCYTDESMDRYYTKVKGISWKSNFISIPEVDKLSFCSIAERVYINKTLPLEDVKYATLTGINKPAPVKQAATKPAAKKWTETSTTEAKGGNAGTVNTMVCPTGSYVTEIFGKSGSLIDNIGIKCSNGRTSGPVGGSGGKPFSMKSPNGFTKLTVNTGTSVNKIQAFNGLTSIGSAGGTGGVRSDLTCPTKNRIMGLKVKANKLVNNIQLICGEEK